MRKIFIGVAMLVVVAMATSCGAAKKAAMVSNMAPEGLVEEVTPLSGPQYRSDAEFYRAVQNGASTDRSIAQKIAMQNCRQSLAAMVRADLQVVIENYVKSLQTEVAAENKASYQEMAYTVVQQRINDVQVVDEKMYREGTSNTFRFYVCLQMSKAALEKAVTEAIANDAKLNLEFDRERFKEVFEAKMAEFKSVNQ